MRDTTIVFDLDGTLVDTAPDLVHATNHVLAASGLTPVPGSALRPYIGYGARHMIVEALRMSGTSRSDSEVDRLFQVFLDYYAANIARDSRPFPGVAGVLDSLVAQGARLAICTNKREALAVALLRELDLADRFAAIAGRDTFPVSKPDPGHLLGTIGLAGGEPARAVMIGDSGVDIATAKLAGIPIVAVTFGYTDGPISEYGPDASIDDYRELEGAIRALLPTASFVLEQPQSGA